MQLEIYRASFYIVNFKQSQACVNAEWEKYNKEVDDGKAGRNV